MSDGDSRARWRRGLAGLLFPLVFVFAFPQRVGDTVLDAGLWLGPLSAASFCAAILGLAPRRALVRGLWLGWLAHALLLHWVAVAVVRYGGAADAVGVLAVLGVALHPALATAATAGAIAWLERRGRATPLALALVFVLGDHLRSTLAGGFPWTLLGTTQLDNELLRPLARLGGVHLVGFGAALGGALLVTAARSLARGGAPASGIGRAAVAWLVLHALGGVLAAQSTPGDGARAAPGDGAVVRVAALQGSVDQGRKWSPEQYARTLERYERLTRAAARAGAGLVVWPETAIPGPLEADPDSAHRLQALARETRAALVVGAVGLEQRDGEISGWYDSAFVIAPDGRLAGRYDKSRLVPFGEYVPLRGLVGGTVRAIARGAATLDVTAGRGPFAVTVALAPAAETDRVPAAEPDLAAAAEAELASAVGGGPASVRLGVPICYELLFPHDVRRFVDDGAELLVAITNDAWYGRTGAPHQFFAITAMRAAENGVPLVRAANTGVSGIFDGNGRAEHRSGLFERGFVIADVRTGTARGATFYARHGDVFVAGAWSVAAFGVARARVRDRRARREAARRADDDTRNHEGRAAP